MYNNVWEGWFNQIRRFQLDSHVWDAQDNHISTDWYNFDQANAL